MGPLDEGDEALARRLAREGRVAPGVLGQALARVQERRARGEAVTLGQLLVQEGVLAADALSPGIAAGVDVQRGQGQTPSAFRLPAARTLPSHVGGCAIERELGRGGMGAVYLGRDAAGRQVAVKVMLEARRGARELERFKRECQALADLEHPGIVRLFGADTEGEQPYMIMEFVPGQDLQKALESGGDVDARLDWIEQVARAVHHAHAQGIVHRDLKPANVLIDEEGRARVTDFGLVRDVNRLTKLTKTGAVVGTPSYMSPEQVTGGELGPASDVFSLGVMLYEALTGALPFEGGSPVQLLAQIVQADPRPPSRRTDAASAAHDALCKRALAKAPEERPSALELAEAIAALRRGEGEAPPGRGPALLVGALIALVALGGAGWWAAQGPAPVDPLAVAADLEERAEALLLADASPLASDAAAIRSLEEQRTALKDPPPTLTLSAVLGLLALAEGDTEGARAALAAGEGGSPGRLALRGGLEALEGDPRVGLDDLNAAWRARVRRPDLLGWRAAAHARTGFAEDGSARQAAQDLEAFEVARRAPLPEREAVWRVEALLAGGQLASAERALARLDGAPDLLRWQVALKVMRLRLHDRPTRAFRSQLEALPGSPPAEFEAERRELARSLFQRAGERLTQGEAVELAFADAHLARQVWPEGPLPPDLRETLRGRTFVRGSGAGIRMNLAVLFADLVPEDLPVQRQVGLLAKIGYGSQDRRRALRILRRAIAAETEPRLLLEQQLALINTLGYLNNIYEKKHVLEEAKEIVALAGDLVERLDLDEAQLADVHAARAVARRRLGDARGAWNDLERAFVQPDRPLLDRYTRMHVAVALGKDEVAYADARAYMKRRLKAETTNRAMFVVWRRAGEPERREEVLECIHHMLRGRPEYAGWWIRSAYLNLQLGRADVAREEVTTARKRMEITTHWAYEGKPELLAACKQAEVAMGQGDGRAELEAAFELFERKRRAVGFIFP